MDEKERKEALYMIGTIHTDFKGPERLRKLLRFIRPSAILVEMPERQVQDVLDARKLMLEEIEEEKQYAAHDLLQQLSSGKKLEERFELDFELLKVLGYEVWGSYEFQKEESSWTRIHAIDNHELLEEMGRLLNSKLETFIEACSKTNATKREWQDLWDQCYHDHEKRFGKLTPEFLESLRKRDAFMEERIRALYPTLPEGNIALINGNAHLVAEYENLFQRLKDLSPIPIKLIDMDKF